MVADCVQSKRRTRAPARFALYRGDLLDLSNFIGKEHVPEQLSREIVRGFLALLHRRGASKPTAARRLSAIKSFVGWLRGEGRRTELTGLGARKDDDASCFLRVPFKHEPSPRQPVLPLVRTVPENVQSRDTFCLHRLSRRSDSGATSSTCPRCSRSTR